MTAALVFLFVALAPAVALAVHLDLERADARRRTRDRLRGPRAALLAAQEARAARRASVDRLLADLRVSVTTWQRRVLEAFFPSALKAAEDLSRAMAKVQRVLAKTGNPPGRRPELAGSDERISR